MALSVGVSNSEWPDRHFVPMSLSVGVDNSDWPDRHFVRLLPELVIIMLPFTLFSIKARRSVSLNQWHPEVVFTIYYLLLYYIDTRIYFNHCKQPKAPQGWSDKRLPTLSSFAHQLTFRYKIEEYNAKINRDFFLLNLNWLLFKCIVQHVYYIIK